VKTTPSDPKEGSRPVGVALKHWVQLSHPELRQRIDMVLGDTDGRPPVAKRKKESVGDAQHPVLQVSIDELEELLADRIQLGEELFEREVSSAGQLNEVRSDFASWDEYNTTLLQRSFTTSGPADQYAKSTSSARIIVPGAPAPTLQQRASESRGHIRLRIRRLSSLMDRLSLFEPIATPPYSDEGQTVSGTRVFVVHGHDDARKQEVASVVQKLTGEWPVILHERPNKGRTVIEKLEAQRPRVGFAIVILTGDDEGRPRLAGEDVPLRNRGRQNVVFEAGFFIGVLGRSRVAILMEENVEHPSDIAGVVYVKLDGHGAWQTELGRELKSAGFSIDLNVLIQ
jgi:hypothetical protein